MQIPGVDWVVAAVLIAEIGIDRSVFVSANHLASWAGVCPGNHESAGKQKSGRARKGNVHLRTILVGAATSASRTKEAALVEPPLPTRLASRGRGGNLGRHGLCCCGAVWSGHRPCRLRWSCETSTMTVRGSDDRR